MEKQISQVEILRKIFSTAYSYEHLRKYGTRKNAIKSLLKRKGLENYSQENAAVQFEQALKIIIETKEFIEKEIRPAQPLSCQTPDEVNVMMTNLRNRLSAKNKAAPIGLIQFAVNWVYTDYYLR